jgi:hypothetical protein
MRRLSAGFISTPKKGGLDTLLKHPQKVLLAGGSFIMHRRQSAELLFRNTEQSYVMLLVKLVADWVKTFSTDAAILFIVAMADKEINTSNSAYSVKSCPASSVHNRRKSDLMNFPL